MQRSHGGYGNCCFEPEHLAATAEKNRKLSQMSTFSLSDGDLIHFYFARRVLSSLTVRPEKVSFMKTKFWKVFKFRCCCDV